MAEKFISFAELKQSIWEGFLENPSNCERANQAVHIAEVFLLRSPLRPENALQEVTNFVDEIIARHKQLCPGSDDLCHLLITKAQTSD